MLSDCEKCWETPCKCGYEYRNWNEKEIANFIYNILKYHDKDRILKLIEEKE